jgi:hypothetical protein
MNPKISLKPRLVLNLLAGTVFFGLLIALAYRTSDLFAGSIQQTLNRPVQSESLSSTPTPSRTQPVAGWNVYRDGTYSFQYPSDWSVTGQYADYYKGRIVTITSPSRTVAIHVYPAQPPYGFGASESRQMNDLKIPIEGNGYGVKENIRSKNKVFVDLKIQKKKEYHIVFGTGYPATDDKVASSSDYFATREVVVKILSTLKITEN